MVESKIKKWSYFVAFVIPCLILYIIFFIVPFFRGVEISFTNWDGLTPKTPIIMGKSEFEQNILNKLKSQKDKDYVLKIYSYSTDDNSYHRIAIKGSAKRKLEHIIGKSGYKPEHNKFVGFYNYKKIFTGKIDKDFYPYIERIEKFTMTSSLPAFISEREFSKEVKGELKKNADCEEIILDAYRYDEQKTRYSLEEKYDEYLITDRLWSLPEVSSEKSVSEGVMDSYIRNLKSTSLDGDKEELDALCDEFASKNHFSEESKAVLHDVNQELFKVAELKKAMSKVWVVTEHRMGVIGFTLFFAIFSVIGINFVAFSLALALDTGIKGQKVLRTIYFLPNVLSMIIVALIWSMLFVQLLPAITGIETWVSDSHKTPWLLVLVAVWQGAGYYMIVYLAGLQNIPTEVIEAAMMDGATGWQRFRMITFPLMIPSLTISLFLTIANAFKSFDLIYALLGPTGYSTGTVPIVMDIYFDAFANKQAGLANAKAMILFLVIVIVTGIQLITMKKKEIEA